MNSINITHRILKLFSATCLLTLMISIVLVSCVSTPIPPDNINKLKVLIGNQANSIYLYKNCKPVGLVEGHEVSTYSAERRAEELNANTLQILYEERNNLRYVRFWSCPE